MKLNEAYLNHILDEINYLLQQTKDLTYKRFLKNETLKRAFARSFEIIGEAAKNTSSDFKRRHKGIDWKGMVGMRDILIHRYFEVDSEILWNVIKERLPGTIGGHHTHFCLA